MNGRNDGLAELLVQLAGNAAALIEKARAAQATRTAQTVDGEAVRRDHEEPTPPAADPGDARPNARQGALQDIIVQQAMRLHTLEAEVARLTAALAAAQAELAGARAAASAAAPPTKPGARPNRKPKPKPKTGAGAKPAG